jgi:hypothetical protein
VGEEELGDYSDRGDLGGYGDAGGHHAGKFMDGGICADRGGIRIVGVWG